MRCADNLRAFTAIVNGTGIVTNERDFDLFCSMSTQHIPQCLRKWSKRCGNPSHQQFINLFIAEPFQQSMAKFCDRNQPMRSRFLKHSPCLHSKVKQSKTYREKCVQNIQSGFEYTNKIVNPIDSFRSFCCVYNRWEKCICDHLNEHCGPESPHIIVDLIRAGTGGIIEQLCPMEKFNPISEDCLKLMPPEGTKALGAKSNSYLSYMFSYWCPNVGYGIID